MALPAGETRIGAQRQRRAGGSLARNRRRRAEFRLRALTRRRHLPLCQNRAMRKHPLFCAGGRWRSCLAAAFALSATLAGPAAAAADVWVLEIDGAIGPASADYFIRSLEDAAEEGADLVVLRLDTPGGLDKSMRDMIKVLLASEVPVATYVSPNGARAASAGTYLMYASHIAAMAPATNIGSSTPVSIGGGGSPFPMPQAPQPPQPAGDPAEGSQDGEAEGTDDAASAGEEEQGGEAEPLSGTAMERKVVNDAVAYIRGIAELRGRNADWAERTVREAANLPASEALERNVIDLVAANLDELLAALDGRVVEVEGRGEVTLDTKSLQITRVEPDWRYELLGVITDPNVAYILLMIGIYGLIFEFYNPGTGVGGVVGVICLLLGAYALQMLPVNYAGLALIVVGICLLAAEAFSPSFGVLGIGGIAAFIIGSVILFDAELPGYRLSIPVIVAVAATTGGLLVFALGAALKARRSAVVSGSEAIVGAEAVALEDFADGAGRVRALGEVWRARSGTDVKEGERMKVAQRDGFDLTVTPKDGSG